MDASRLKNLFEKLNFQVEMFVDLKECEMRQVINEFAQECEQNANRYEAISIIVLSHGTDGYIYGVDCENKLKMDTDVLNIFDDILVGKPKIFIFQACRGEHLNQKDMSYSNSATTSPYSSSNLYYSSCISSTSSSSSAPTTPTTPISATTTTTTTTSMLVDDESETINSKFRHLKVSSNNPAHPIQLKYKKNKTSIFTSSHLTSRPCNATSSSSSSSSSNPARTGLKTTRSRSHSRSKYSAFVASAATAMKNAINKQHHQQQHQQSSVSTSQSTQTFATTTSNFIDGRPIKTFLPSRSDFFIWYSSVRGFVSHRDADGSPFIKCLVTVFSKCAYELELIEMVAKVNMLMQQYEKKHFDSENACASYFMVPVMEYHLTKKFYFNP
jgi:hypothetical protein